MVVREQGVAVAELAELELLVAAVAEVAERSCAVSCAEVPMEYWVRGEKMGVDCNTAHCPMSPPQQLEIQGGTPNQGLYVLSRRRSQPL